MRIRAHIDHAIAAVQVQNFGSSELRIVIETYRRASNDDRRQLKGMLLVMLAQNQPKHELGSGGLRQSWAALQGILEDEALARRVLDDN